MDRGTKRRLLLGSLSNLVSKLSTTLIQLVQVPVFLHFWNTGLYGEWMIVNSIPSYLAFSNIGFGSVASNEMNMLNSAGDREGALSVFQSCWWLITLVCGSVGLLLGPVLYFLPIDHLLKLHSISATDTKWMVFYLGLAVLFSQLEQLMGAAYTCIGRYPYGSLLNSIFGMAAYAAMMVAVAMGCGPRQTALVYAVADACGTVILGICVRRDIPWIRYGWSKARFSEIRRLSGPAIAFMGFPIGNALNLQGTLLAVQYALGPVEVVIFSTARTVSRVALQMVQMVNNTFWPELSAAYGSKNMSLVRTLHRRSCQLALIMALCVITGMIVCGPWLLTHWTRGHVPPDRTLLTILLTVVVFYSLWSTSATLATATNQHQRLAFFYILGTGITVIFTFLLAHWIGLYGAAASLLLSELVMDVYVLPNSLRLTEDTFSGFVASMFHVPSSLYPGALLRRLRRARAPEAPQPSESEPV